MSDEVNRPKHYTSHPSGVECIQVAEHMGFNLGNAVKYIWRASLKGKEKQDLEKAIWYLQRELKRVFPEQPKKAVTTMTLASMSSARTRRRIPVLDEVLVAPHTNDIWYAREPDIQSVTNLTDDRVLEHWRGWRFSDGQQVGT